MSVYRPTYTDPKTGKSKQSATWWYDFVLAGRRYRDSTHSARKTIAAQAEKSRRLQIERALAGMPRDVDFSAAADDFGLVQFVRARLAADVDQVEDFFQKIDTSFRTD